MLPGNNSMPVSRQLMPRMWLSPSPRTLFARPRRMSIRSLNGSSGVMISFSVKSVPVSLGQKAGGIVPLGLNMIISRCRGRVGLARPRLGRPTKKGSAAAEMPTCLRNSRRRIAFIVRCYGKPRQVASPPKFKYLPRQPSDTDHILVMQSAQSKVVPADAVPPGSSRGEDRFSAEGKDRRRELLAAINASQSEPAEEADAALSKYLDKMYPETIDLAY